MPEHRPGTTPEPSAADAAGATRPDEYPAGPTLPGPPSREAGGPPAVPPELVGQARYRMLALLGRSGMGAVYQAEHTQMERTVALKVIGASLVGDPAAVQRF